ncbi:hypothetical protein ABIB62_004237 [Mucilaginibacter sp. UYP25]|uniref:hypothetical protein n=1 Tax=unclassified Mucilaginibacter TaxID=2617802 RepID=UPI003390B4BA
MKKIFLTVLLLPVFYAVYGQTQVQVMTTGNNTINSANPYAADVVIGSDKGTRHDASMMWWSSGSADRISLTNDTFYLSQWNTVNPNIALGGAVGYSSFFLGNVLIGKTSQSNTSYKLDVVGGIRANQVVVNTSGADFVFAPEYRLPTLATIKSYVKKEHHLPGIATAAQMQTAGLDLGDNQTVLLQKIEELTLYVIRMDSEITKLKKQNKKLATLIK